MDDHTNTTRRVLLGRGLAGLALFLSTSALPVSASALFGHTDKMPPGQSIYRVRGTVRIDGLPATRDSTVTSESMIETDRKSRIIFRLGNDAFLLRANSRLEFSGDSEALVGAMRLVSGALLSVFGPRTTASPVQLSTQTAVLGIRGTGLYVESMKEETYLCTCYGTVDVQARDDPTQRETLTTRHHEAPRRILAVADDGKRIIAAPMKNHRDEELELIEAIVGRKPPFPPRRESAY